MMKVAKRFCAVLVSFRLNKIVFLVLIVGRGCFNCGVEETGNWYGFERNRW